MSDPFDNFDEESDVGLDEASKKYTQGDRPEWFKADKNSSYRVSLMFFHPIDLAVRQAARRKDSSLSQEALVSAGNQALSKRAEELGKPVDQLTLVDRLHLDVAKFHKVDGHYKDGIGYVVSRYGKDGQEADAVWKQLGDPRTYFTTVLLFYPCNRAGEVNKARLKALDFEVKPWRFAKKVYSQLHDVATGLRSNDLRIANQDLMLKCTNGDFQNFEINPTGKALWPRVPDLKPLVLDAATKLYPTMMKPFRDMSTADLRIKLGLSPEGSGGAQGVTTGVDDAEEFDDLLEGV